MKNIFIGVTAVFITINSIAEELPDINTLGRELYENHVGYWQGIDRCSTMKPPASFKPYQSREIVKGEIEKISVDITGLDNLCLRTSGHTGGGHAVWGEPVLIDKAGKKTRLSDLRPQVLWLWWADLEREFNRNRARIAGRHQKFGLFAHPQSYISYAVDKKYVRFESNIGLNDSASAQRKIVFNVDGAFDANAIKLLEKGPRNKEQLGDLLKDWVKVVGEESEFDAFKWVYTRDGAPLLKEAINTMLARLGREKALIAQVKSLTEKKVDGNSWEWMGCYLDVLNSFTTYKTFDDKVAELECVYEFVAGDGGDIKALSDSVTKALAKASDVRKAGSAGFDAFIKAELDPLIRTVIFAHPALDFKELLVDVRQLPMFYHNVDQYLGQHSAPGEGLAVLTDWKSGTPKVRYLTKGRLPVGATQHPDISYDGKRVVFGFCDHTQSDPVKRRYLIHEAAIDGSFVRQVTGTAKDPWDKSRRDGYQTVMIEDFDPHYLPCGDIVFTSTRAQCIARCHAGRNAPSFLIYRGSLDGSEVYPLSYGEANELDPAVLNDGRVIYNRWEYINRHDCKFHKLWTMKPDGTVAANFYGNLTSFPFSITEPRAIPGSHKVMATATAHHSFTAGSIILIDPLKGLEGPEPIYKLTPEVKYPEAQGWDMDSTYNSPFPITEKIFLAAYSPYPHFHQGHGPRGVENLGKRGQRQDAYAVYLVYHVNGRAHRQLIYKPEGKISCLSPMPVRPRKLPPAIPSLLEKGSNLGYGKYYVQNVYESMHEIEPGSVKYLRVNALFNQPAPKVPHRGWVMDEVAKGVIGTVPVEADGSVAFRVPSRTPVQLQLLDKDRMCLMNMRSFIYLQDGESASCVGCHENRMASPPKVINQAAKVHDLKPVPGPDAAGGFNYVSSVQPVLDRHCIRCHGVECVSGKVDLTGVYTERDPGRYPGGKLRMPKSYDYLVRNPKYYKLMDRNRETDCSIPRDYLSHASGLPAFLKKHAEKQGVDLSPDDWERVITWLDVNAQLYGNYSFNRPEDRRVDSEGEKALRAYVKDLFGDELAKQPFETLVNNGAVEESRILKAPLSEKAGGWGQLKKQWGSRDDAQYKKMLSLVEASLKPLTAHDVHGTCGTPDKCRCHACRVAAADSEYRQHALQRDSSAVAGK